VSERSKLDSKNAIYRYKNNKIMKNEYIKNKNTLLGTINFFSPEIINDDEGYTNIGACDYWALGVMLFMIFTNEYPFAQQDILDNITSYNINWNKLLSTKIHPQLFDLIQQFMKFDPDERPSCLKDVKNHPYFIGMIII